ncbi:MAG: dihydroorotase [Sphingomonadales bacterium]
MKLLIKQARIVDPASPHHGQVADLLIENGILTTLSKKITVKADREIDIPGLHVSPGWVDCFAHFADPGYEQKETLETGAAAAAAGGFTDVMIVPNTAPALHNKASVEYILHKARTLAVNIHPIGAVTRNTEGKELAEMYDMKNNGAIAFSDGLHCIQSSGLIIKALQYIKAFDGVLIQLPDDKSINPQGLINEGILSTQLGLPGKPAIAEELIVQRDIALNDYAESKLHLTAISTAGSVAALSQAKKQNSGISCSATPYHLFFCEEDLNDYNTNLKVNPPLRTKTDREALRHAVRDGVIDCLATHHLPHEKDAKVVEFEYAQHGMIGLETAYAALRTSVQELSSEQIVTLMAINPRKIFGLPAATIAEGQCACLTFFDPAAQWTVTPETLRSRSQNSPFIGKTLQGKVVGIFNKNSLTLV